MTPIIETKPANHLRDAWRGVAEGAALGVVLVLIRLARAWWQGAEVKEFSAHLNEVGIYSAVVIVSMAFIFGVGRAISGGWAGSMAGALVLGIVGVGVGAFVFPSTSGPPIGIFTGLGIGGTVGSVLGAIAERLMRRKIQRRRNAPEADVSA